MPKHVSNVIELPKEDSIISAIPAYNFESDKNIILTSKNGLIKRSKLKDFRLQRYNKASSCMKLKENDEVVSVCLAKKDILMVTKNGYYCKFQKIEVPVVGVRGSGVKGIALKEDEVVETLSIEDAEYITLFTNQNTAKRIKLSEIEETGRAKRGGSLIKKVKSVNYEILSVIESSAKTEITYITEENKVEIKNSEIPIMDLASTGSTITKKQILNAISSVVLKSLGETRKEEENTSKEENIQFTFEDFKL